MAVEQGIFASEFLEKFGELTLKEFAEKYVATSQVEKPLQTVETETAEEEAAEKPSEETVVNSAIKEIAANVQEILAQVQDFAYKDKINRELHEELSMYKNDFRRELLYPVLRGIIRWHDKLSEQYAFYDKAQQEENADITALFSKLLKEYKKLANGLEALLYQCNIEPDIPVNGDELNLDRQTVVSYVMTENAEQDGKIAKCVTTGFKKEI